MTASQNKKEPDPVIRWITENLDLQQSSSNRFVYDHMQSQSGECLPEIYIPFDPRKIRHLVDRAQILDYRYSVGGQKLLDFGPGDGWPSLGVASLVEEVVGVDASKKRVEICSQNALRLSVDNVKFIHVPEGGNLPFEDDCFDGVMAASSIEQSPDPGSTLKELHRVLKPAGKLRMFYESLGRYMNGRERELWLMESGKSQSRIIIYDRHIREEYIRHFGLVLGVHGREVEEIFQRHGQQVKYEGLTPAILEELADSITQSVRWTNIHPSCRSFLGLLTAAGFRSATPTYSGGWFIRKYLENMECLPGFTSMVEIDAYISPLVKLVVTMETPAGAILGDWEPMITAMK